MKTTNKNLNKIAKDFIAMMKVRRSNYAVENKPILTDAELANFINDCVDNAPSSFNFKTQKLVILFGDKHRKLWEITEDDLPVVARGRIKMFSQAYATVLFYVDNDVIKELGKAYPQYKDMFMTWEVQANAMLQFQIWTGLCNLGYGVNIQHYNPLIDKEVAREFNIPNNWKLIAQMPIGKSMGIYPKLKPCSKEPRVLIRK